MTKDELKEMVKNHHLYYSLTDTEKKEAIKRLDDAINSKSRCVFICDDERERQFDEDMWDMGESHPGHPDNFGNQ